MVSLKFNNTNDAIHTRLDSRFEHVILLIEYGNDYLHNHLFILFKAVNKPYSAQTSISPQGRVSPNFTQRLALSSHPKKI